MSDVSACEDPEEFEALRRGLEEDYRPVGSLEHGLVERIACCTWRLRRAHLIEPAIMRREHFELERIRAEAEMERTRGLMDYVRSALRGDPVEDDSEDDDTSADDDTWEDDGSNEGHNQPAEAEWLRRANKIAAKSFCEAGAAYDKAEEELKNSAFSVDQVFLRSEHRVKSSCVTRQLLSGSFVTRCRTLNGSNQPEKGKPLRTWRPSSTSLTSIAK